VSVFYYKKGPEVQGINKEFIRFIRENFVGVGIDGVKPGSPAEWAVFGGAAEQSYNGFAVCTAAGKFLGTADDLEGCIEKYKKLARSERIPAALIQEKDAKAVPAPPAGGLVLMAYCTHLERTESGEYSRAKRMLNDIFPTTMASPTDQATTGCDTLWLTQEEWKALVPARPEVGAKVEIPATVTRRILGLHACDFHPVTGGEDGNRPGSAQTGGFRLSVERATASSILLRLEGSAQTGSPFDPSNLVKGCEMKFLGFLEIDRAKGRFTRFDVVGLGECWGKPTNAARSGKLDAPPRRWPVGVAFELVVGDRPVDRTPPKYVMSYVSYDYFGTGKQK
jgi:hypothetical protein